MIVLDTHALVWWVSDPVRIPPKARRAIDSAVTDRTLLAVSSISLWEIAMLVSRSRLALTMDVGVWLAHVEALPFLSFVPVDNGIAIRSVRLDGFAPGDPADRMIVATALGLGAALVTADASIRAYRPLKTIWD